ncbi:MAG: hypothetical protein V1806_05570 [Pseudomonadota bacterium]
MAEIKSSIQIAMERASALGGGDSNEEAREEGKRQGRALGRRAASGELAPASLAASLAQLPQDQQGSARQAAASALMEDLEEGWQGRLTALAALAAAGPAEAAVVELARVLAQEERVTVDLHQELAQELLAALAAEGIGGSAVHPNPAAHPQLKQRYEQAVAALGPRRQAALSATSQAFQTL